MAKRGWGPLAGVENGWRVTTVKDGRVLLVNDMTFSRVLEFGAMPMIIHIIEENLEDCCTIRLIEPRTDGALQQADWQCRQCGEVIDVDELPCFHECSRPEKMEEPDG